jgi:uncharacterized protein DUF87
MEGEKEDPWLTPNIVLGWKVTKNLEPRYWSETENPKPGDHSIDDVVTTLPKTVGHHTVIIAQSGSGKSFFLGRLIEEIVMKTRGRVLVLDSNSDFRKVGRPKSDDHWTKPEYRYPKPRAFLPDEPSQAEFNKRWRTVATRLYTKNKRNANANVNEVKLLQLDWLKFPVDLLAEDAAQEHRDQVRHCHRLVNSLAELAAATENEEWLDGDFLRRAHLFCGDTAKDAEEGNEAAIIEKLKEQFGSPKPTATSAAIDPGRQTRVQGLIPAGAGIFIPSMAGIFGKKDQVVQDKQGKILVHIPRHLSTLAGIFPDRNYVPIEEFEPIYQLTALSRRFVPPEALNFYFGRAFELKTSGLVDPDIRNALERPDHRDIEVVDLPSVGNLRQQKMAICTFLEAEWARARAELDAAIEKDAEADQRVPTFIVVEEAHNIVPAKAVTAIEKKLREEFRRIAAEGRKYGLFLILVSQRPDKLDRMVMSECENRAVMKVGSSLILRTTCEILGLDGVIPRLTDKVLDFDLGRALLAGPWVSDEPAVLVTAARRTLEGGHGLKPEHWAKPRSGSWQILGP